MFRKIFTIIAVALMLVAGMSGADAAGKVKAYYYYGDGCGWCGKLAPWLAEFEQTNQDAITIEHFEIFKDKTNHSRYSQIMKLYGIPQEEQGTPTMVVNNKVLIGYDRIKNELQKEFEAAKKTLEEKGEESPAPAPSEKPAPSQAMDEFSFTAIVLAAAADSVNPCAMMVLIILMASLMTYQKNDLLRVVATATAFVFAVFVTYFALGLGITNMIASAKVAAQISKIVGVIAVIVGLANLKDAFFYRKGGWAMEIPEAWRNRLTSIVAGATSPLGAFAAGAVVTMFELPCTGGPYLFGLALMAERPSLLERMALLLLYNIIFILPLVVIAILCIRGMAAVEKAEEFRNKYLRWFHGIAGAIMLGGGAWLFMR